MKLKIKIIADNGGGLTLQIVDRELRYQHTYTDASQCAYDISAAINEPDAVADWGKNESDDWVEIDRETIRNGGYRVYNGVEELLQAERSERLFGRNDADLVREYHVISGQ